MWLGFAKEVVQQPVSRRVVRGAVARDTPAALLVVRAKHEYVVGKRRVRSPAPSVCGTGCVWRLRRCPGRRSARRAGSVAACARIACCGWLHGRRWPRCVGRGPRVPCARAARYWRLTQCRGPRCVGRGPRVPCARAARYWRLTQCRGPRCVGRGPRASAIYSAPDASGACKTTWHTPPCPAPLQHPTTIRKSPVRLRRACIFVVCFISSFVVY